MLTDLLEHNLHWASEKRREDPDYFKRLSALQRPEYLWIGCSDSRVPANVITGLEPGEVFVHRNVANLVHRADLNLLSVLEFAVETLEVKHIIVCGHYGCGGVRAALEDVDHGLIDNWLRGIRELALRCDDSLHALEAESDQVDRMCELNVIQQVYNVSRTTVMQSAWQRGQAIAVHGWIYGLTNGLLRDLETTVDGVDQALPTYRRAMAARCP